MKKFIIQTIAFFVLIIGILGSVFAVRYVLINRVSWKLPNETNVLFMGASHILNGINDAKYPNSINLASSSERYLFTYLKLERLLKQNPQIDTLFLEMAPTDIWENTDTKYYTVNELSDFLPKYFLFFNKEEWNIYTEKIFPQIDNSFFINTFIPKIIKFIPPKNIHYWGAYAPREQVFDRFKDKYKSSIRNNNEGNAINHLYLRKIINLAKEYDVKLLFLYMPMYEPERFYNQEEYYEAYEKYFSDVELLDYNKFDMPDSLRADEHHLNTAGAEYFTLKLHHDMDSLRVSKIE